jgi:PEGA domain/WD40-like Beta Propeller Repeat
VIRFWSLLRWRSTAAHSSWTGSATVRTRSRKRQWQGPYHLFAVALLALIVVGGVAAAASATGLIPRIAQVDNLVALLRGDAAAMPGDETDVGLAVLQVTSTPEHARVLVDGRDRGKTPLVVHVAAGPHQVALNHPDTLDDAREIQVAEAGTTAANFRLWRRNPSAVRLRPPYPGAVISDAVFLTDGRIAITAAVPGGAATGATPPIRELWLLDVISGQLSRFAVADAAGLRARALAAAPDGKRVAYLQQSPPHRNGAQAVSAGPAPTYVPNRLDEVWVTQTAGTSPLSLVFRLPPATIANVGGATTERLLDVTWTPDGRRLLVVTVLGDPNMGTPLRSRLLVVDVDSQEESPRPSVIDLLTLPAQVVPGSYSWAPDGRWLAFLARALAAPGGRNLTTLNLLALEQDGGVADFRYLADLGSGVGVDVAPVGWEPVPASERVGRIVYRATVTDAAPASGQPFGPFTMPSAGQSRLGLFIATPYAPTLSSGDQRRVPESSGMVAPVWRATNTNAPVLAFVRGEDDRSLVARVIEPANGSAREAGLRLPLDVAVAGSAVSARWDVARGRALLFGRPANSDALAVWLVDFEK